ncbi:transmembrane protein 266-like [Pteropus vampyrus]|uniref:Transmembrane protein 266-like n=1 Tax=Pteropus vampyrus TaxID=132908 RepID=A0A6P6BZI8_PTEVA|nr:transmembrane protein 266-like [Pteropus vampyrus]
MSSAQPATEGRASDVEILSQHVDEGRSFDPGPLVPFAYRDLPLAAADLSAAGSQLLSNLDEDDQEGSAWLQPCCGKRAAAWQVFLLSASVNSLLVACVVLVVTLLTLELLIDVKLLQCLSSGSVPCCPLSLRAHLALALSPVPCFGPSPGKALAVAPVCKRAFQTNASTPRAARWQVGGMSDENASLPTDSLCGLRRVTVRLCASAAPALT